MLIDGRAIARELKETLREELAALDRPAGIATLLVGDELGAQVYQRRIDRGANELGSRRGWSRCPRTRRSAR